ncbi:MAG: phospholipid carrier-dependent glycosyltransferase [Chitinophagales bacterium]|nr:phospholipid carrier-dependent glycosyltransferase [Chitinophagales bacterium]
MKIVQSQGSLSRSPKLKKEQRTTKKTWPWGRLGLFLLITIVFGYNYLDVFDSKLNLNGDNASYYLLGKSIHLGQGYTLYNDLEVKPHNHFPPGYPIIISFLMFFSKKISFIKAMNGVFLLSSMLLSFSVLKKMRMPWQVALVSILFIGFNYHLLKSSVIIMSEIPFVFFSTLSLWYLMKTDFSKDFLRTQYFYGFIISLAFAFHIRTAGIALVGGALCYMLLTRKWKGLLATSSGFIILALPWILRSKILGLRSSYQSQLIKINPYQPELGNASLADFAARFGNNFVRYVTKEFPSGVLPFWEVNYKEVPAWPDWGLGSILILLILFGIVELPKYRSLIVGYLGGTFGILFLWPDVWKGVRFLLPVLPILIFLIVYALSWLLRKGLTLLKLPASYSPFLLLPLIFLFTQEYTPNKDRQWQSYPLSRLSLEAKNTYNPKWKNYIEIAKYAKDNLGDSDIIACRKPQLFHIFSDRPTCKYAFEEDDGKLLESLKKNNVKYVVVDQLGYSSTGKYLVPAVNKNSQNFKKILHLKKPDTYLLQFFSPK